MSVLQSLQLSIWVAGLLTLSSACFASEDNVGVESETTGEISDQAKEQFLRGIDFFSKAQYEEALAAFDQSYKIRPKPSVLYNIGMCQKALYRLTESIRTFELYLHEMGSELSDGRRRVVEQAIAEMRPLVGRLIIVGAPDESRVSLDNVYVGTTPLPKPLLVAPGRHMLRVSNEAYESLVVTVNVASGADLTVRAVLVTADQSYKETAAKPLGPQPTMTDAELGIRPLRIGAMSSFAGAAVSAVIGTVFTVRYWQNRNDLSEVSKFHNSLANREDELDPTEQAAMEDAANEYADLREATKTAETGAIVSFVVSGVLVVTGVGLSIALRSRQNKKKQSVALHAAPGGFSISF